MKTNEILIHPTLKRKLNLIKDPFERIIADPSTGNYPRHLVWQTLEQRYRKRASKIIPFRQREKSP